MTSTPQPDPGDLQPLPCITLKMELLETKSKRTVTVPAAISLYDLHQVIQNLFGFADDHLWSFTDPRTGDEYGCDVTPWEASGENGSDPHDHAVTEILRAPKATAQYWYDFGDDWFVRVTRLADPEAGPPACLSASGPNAIDDIGGPRALNRFIARLRKLEEEGAGDLDDDDDPDGQSFWGIDTQEKRRAFLAGPSAEELSAWIASQTDFWRASIAADEAAAARRALFKNVGRNDPCPCGSGKKYKKCCLGKYDKSGYPV